MIYLLCGDVLAALAVRCSPCLVGFQLACLGVFVETLPAGFTSCSTVIVPWPPCAALVIPAWVGLCRAPLTLRRVFLALHLPLILRQKAAGSYLHEEHILRWLETGEVLKEAYL